MLDPIRMNAMWRILRQFCTLCRMPRHRRPLARVAGFALLADAGLVVLARPCTAGAPGTGRAWWAHATTLDLAVVGCWWTAAMLAAWLTVTIVTCTASRVVPGLRALRALDACTAPLVRLAVDRACAWSLRAGALGVVAAAAVPAAAHARTSPPTRPPVVSITPDGDVVVSPSPSPSQPMTTAPAPRPPAPRAPTPAPRAPHPVPASHRVVAGDNLWRIAGAYISFVHGAAARDADIAPYWRRVVDANRATLRSRDPNLIFPGEVVELPPA